MFPRRQIHRAKQHLLVNIPGIVTVHGFLQNTVQVDFRHSIVDVLLANPGHCGPFE